MTSDSKFFQRKSVVTITAVLCCVLWGSAFPALKLSYEHMIITNESQRLLVAGIRFVLSGAGILVFQRLRMKTSIMPQRREMPMILLMGVVQTFIAYVLYYIAIANTTGVKSSVLASSGIFFTVLFASIAVRSDRINRMQALGMLLGLAGLVCVNFSSLSSLDLSFTFKGEGLLLIHCALISAFLVIVRKYAQNMDVVKINGWQFLIGGLLLIAVGWIGSPQPLQMDAVAAGLLGYLAAISAVTMSVWYVLLRYHSVSMLEQYKFLMPLIGSLFSVVMLPGEHLGPELLVAALLVAGGIVLVNRKNSAEVQSTAAKAVDVNTQS